MRTLVTYIVMVLFLHMPSFAFAKKSLTTCDPTGVGHCCAYYTSEGLCGAQYACPSCILIRNLRNYHAPDQACAAIIGLPWKFAPAKLRVLSVERTPTGICNDKLARLSAVNFALLEE